MSGPTSDGEYLMSIMWTGHSIFPDGTLLKQQGNIILNKFIFKSFHLLFLNFHLLILNFYTRQTKGVLVAECSELIAISNQTHYVYVQIFLEMLP